MSYKNIKFSASIMCANWLEIKKQIVELERNKIDFIHYDIIDGNYVPDFTMGSSIINSIKSFTKTQSHYHLMVDEPMRIFGRFNLEKNDIFTIHQETSKNLHNDLISIKKLCKTSVALAPATSIEHLEYVLEDVNDVLILTVNPGFMSQKMIPQIIKKIEKLKKIIDDMNLDISITVDGNVNKGTLVDFVKAGANILVLGSSGLFVKNKTLTQSLDEIKETIYKIK
jgi:ribulose-phosphate 3-epimerase